MVQNPIRYRSSLCGLIAATRAYGLKTMRCVYHAAWQRLADRWVQTAVPSRNDCSDPSQVTVHWGRFEWSGVGSLALGGAMTSLARYHNEKHAFAALVEICVASGSGIGLVLQAKATLATESASSLESEV